MTTIATTTIQRNLPIEQAVVNRDPTMSKVTVIDDMVIDIPPRSFVAKISVEIVDDEGDVLLLDGLDSSRFMKTKTVLYNHDSTQEAASCRWIKRASGSLIALATCPARPTDILGPNESWLPDVTLAKMACDPPLVRGTSVGFQIIESRYPTSRDRTRFKSQRLRRIISKWRLDEWSVVAIPCNEDALIDSVVKGKMPQEQAEIIAGHKLTIEPTVQSIVRKSLDTIFGRVYSTT